MYWLLRKCTDFTGCSVIDFDKISICIHFDNMNMKGNSSSFWGHLPVWYHCPKHITYFFYLFCTTRCPLSQSSEGHLSKHHFVSYEHHISLVTSDLYLVWCLFAYTMSYYQWCHLWVSAAHICISGLLKMDGLVPQQTFTDPQHYLQSGQAFFNICIEIMHVYSIYVNIPCVYGFHVTAVPCVRSHCLAHLTPLLIIWNASALWTVFTSYYPKYFPKSTT